MEYTHSSLDAQPDGAVLQPPSKPVFASSIFDVHQKADGSTENPAVKVAKRPSLSSIFGGAKADTAASTPPKEKAEELQKAVQDFLKKSSDLAQKHDQYESLMDEVEKKKGEQSGRGTKALHELLADVYKFEREIEQSAHVTEITVAMRDLLKEEHGINTTDDTPLMTIVVKLVVKTSNRQTASNYSRALRVAKAEGIAPVDLANFLASQGGVSKTLKTAAQKQADANNKEAFKTRTEKLRSLMVDLVAEGADTFKAAVTETVTLPINTKTTLDDEKDRATGDFLIFLGVRDPKNDGQFRIGAGYDLGRPFEDMMLRHIAKRIAIDADIGQATNNAA